MSLTAGILASLAGTLITTLQGDKKSRIEESRERIADAAATAARTAPHTPEPETAEMRPAVDFLKEIAARHHFEVTEHERDEQWVTCSFEYQGGWFLCFCGTYTDELLLQFRDFAELPYNSHNYQRILSLCYRYTRDYRYAKFTHSYDEKDNKLHLHIYIESIGPSEEAFMHYVALCFRLSDLMRRELAGESIDEEEIISQQRDRFMLINAEMAQEDRVFRQQKPEAKDPNEGTIKEYLDYLFDGEETEDLISLTVQSAEGTKEIRQKDKIAHFDLLGSIIAGAGEEAHFASTSPVVLTVEAAANHYIFSLHPLESGREFLSVRMTAVCTPHEFLQDYVPAATYEPRATSMRLCYVKTELPESEQPEDQELPTTDWVKQLSHGHQLMQQQCYLQAIAVITPLVRAMKPTFFGMNDEEKEVFVNAYFQLGFCYNELHQYEKAYYYLELAHSCNRFDYSMEYFNSLTKSGDIRIFRELNPELDAIRKQIEDIDNDDDRGTEKMMAYREQLLDYFSFLMRRRGCAQIHFGYLDEAEQIFKQLLEHEGSHDYAEKELKHIEELRSRK